MLLKRASYSRNEKMRQLVRDQAIGALDRVEEIAAESVSINQRYLVQDSEEMEHIRAMFQELIIYGGAEIFNATDSIGTKSRKMLSIIERALLKFAGSPIKSDREDLEIEPGEEDILMSEYMIMPVSQAVLIIEEELIPRGEGELKKNPGDKTIQDHLEKLKAQADLLRKARFFPRSRPFNPAFEGRPFLNDAILMYSDSGELLVKMRMPTFMSSGNRIDRLRDNLRYQVVHDAAGKGLEKGLDSKNREARGIESGRRGSWFNTTDHLGTEKMFRSLSRHFPFLKRIENQEELKRLADMAEEGDRESLHAALENMMLHDRNLLWTSEPLLLGKEEGEE